MSNSSLNFGSNSGLSATQLGQITLNGAPTTFTLNGGFLVAGAVSGYSAWQSNNGTMQAANLDHDNDGVPNGVEHFHFGTANSTGNSNPLPGFVQDALSVTWVRNSDFPGFPANYGSAGAVVVETSTTLANSWTAVPEGVGAGFVEITGNNVKYTFPAGSKNFARLKVVVP